MTKPGSSSVWPMFNESIFYVTSTIQASIDSNIIRIVMLSLLELPCIIVNEPCFARQSPGITLYQIWKLIIGDWSRRIIGSHFGWRTRGMLARAFSDTWTLHFRWLICSCFCLSGIYLHQSMDFCLHEVIFVSENLFFWFLCAYNYIENVYVDFYVWINALAVEWA